MHAGTLPKKTEGSAEKSSSGEKQRRRDKNVCLEIQTSDGCCDGGRIGGPGRGLLVPPVALLVFSPGFRRSACCALLLVFQPDPKRNVPTPVFELVFDPSSMENVDHDAVLLLSSPEAHSTFTYERNGQLFIEMSLMSDHMF